MTNIHLRELVDRNMVGLSQLAAGYLMEAGEFCLLSNSHQTGVSLKIYGLKPCQCRLEWDGEITNQMKATWNDIQEATENGAAAIAILVAIRLTEYVIVERSYKGTGFDYYLGVDDTDFYPFERKARLEVSGLWCQPRYKVRERIKIKKEQISVSDYMGLPGYVGIIEFSNPSADLELTFT